MFKVGDQVVDTAGNVGHVHRALANGFLAIRFGVAPNTEKAFHGITGQHWEDDKDKIVHAKGIKFNKDKTPLRFIDPNFTEEVAMVFKLGAEKYGDFNYKKGLNISEVLEALERHTLDLKRGKDIDAESNRHQTAHIAACAQMLYYLLLNKPELDDREKIYK